MKTPDPLPPALVAALASLEKAANQSGYEEARRNAEGLERSSLKAEEARHALEATIHAAVEEARREAFRQAGRELRALAAGCLSLSGSVNAEECPRLATCEGYAASVLEEAAAAVEALDALREAARPEGGEGENP